MKEYEETMQKCVYSNPTEDSFPTVVLGFLFEQSIQPARMESVPKSAYPRQPQLDLSYHLEQLRILTSCG